MSNNEHVGVTNRLKIVLVEQGKTIDGLLSNWAIRSILHLVGVKTKHSQQFRYWVKSHSYWNVDVRLLIKSTKE